MKFGARHVEPRAAWTRRKQVNAEEPEFRIADSHFRILIELSVTSDHRVRIVDRRAHRYPYGKPVAKGLP